MLWKDKLRQWKKGIPLKYPLKLKNRFFYETSQLISDTSIYKEKFIINKKLDKMIQNYLPFIKYINKSKNKYITSFYNLSKTSYLIIPIPKKGKDFTTIKDFIDNASKTQQIEFWKKTSKIITFFLNKKKKIYISTHGLGISYFHLRIDTFPKYYVTKSFIN